MSILNEIVEYKKAFVEERKNKITLNSLIAALAASDDFPREFMDPLIGKVHKKQPAVIAEIKKASPSKGVICENFDPVEIAKGYHEAGAMAISVLTDEKYFQGSDEIFRQVRTAMPLPMLRKDFIIDEYQVIESRVIGADAILLIAAILDDEQLSQFSRMAYDLGMDVIVEVHSHDELQRALKIRKKLQIQSIGVNNRDLNDFTIDIQHSIDISKELTPDLILISESGIETQEHLQTLQGAGIYCYLIGSSFMKTANPGDSLRHLLQGV